MIKQFWSVLPYFIVVAGTAWFCHASQPLGQIASAAPAVTPGRFAEASLAGWTVGNPADNYATILFTTNGGADWIRQGSPEEIANAPLGCIAAVDLKTAWAVGMSARGYSAIYHTTNGGQRWCRQGNYDTVGNVSLAKICACSREVVWVSGAAGAVLRTTDGGQTWQNRSPAGYSNYFQGITALDANSAWAAGHMQDGYATILHTTNGGLSWVRQSGGCVTNLANILSIGAADARRLWAVGFHGTSAGRVIGTTNGGTTWQILYEAAYHANELYVVNTTQVYVALDSFVIRTLNGGRSWEQVGTISTAYATMGICAPDGRNVWACSENWAGGFIYHIPDGGADWINQTPTNGVASLSYISLVRRTDPASLGTLAIAVTPSNGGWTLPAPPVGYTGPLRGTGSMSAVQAPGGYYEAAFSPLPGFHTPSNQTAWVTPGQDGVITGAYRSRQVGDYDGDGKTDPALYNSLTGDWAVRLSGQAYQSAAINLGGPGWLPVAGDFDGDGRSDPCVTQPSSGIWAVRMSGHGYGLGWIASEISGFQPVRGDFDGDAKADCAMYRESDGQWSIRLSTLNYAAGSFPFGGPGWSPVAGDFDGDDQADPGVYEKASGLWQVLLSASGYTPAQIQIFQPTTDNLQPVPADYDGDRKTDPAIYDADTGVWLILYSGRAYAPVARFCGCSECQPVTGDLDGDDLADCTVYSPTLARWISLLSRSAYTAAEVPLGGGPFRPVW